MNKPNKMPELLCPAGSMTALEAAIDGGADAVYFGGTGFNARINAENFDENALRAAIEKCHVYGVKAYITQNTLVYDREMRDYLAAAETAYRAGADALIVADLGGAAAIHRELPELELHASTQMSGHSLEAAKKLSGLGFSRMVCAREMSREDIKYFTDNSPIEAEVFVHGALCVCHSGQCLFSSLVGGRSGNRGECAQPCRLPFADSKNPYPLSLKDLSLARHVPELIDLGIASLKIEGRMKSPEYVREVTRVWRKLLDEGRGADDYEMKYLAEIFSRGGFTDGYFTSNIGKGMMGVRSDADKQSSRELSKFTKIERKVPIIMSAKITNGNPISLTLTKDNVSVSACGEIPMQAQNAPLDRESVERNLTKLGATPFVAEEFELSLDAGLMLPLSRLNALRRDAVEKLTAVLAERKPGANPESSTNSGEPSATPAESSINFAPGTSSAASVYSPQKRAKTAIFARTARFCSPEQIPDNAKDAFDIIYLPLDKFSSKANGVILPPVIFDSEREKVKSLLRRAKESGAIHALIGNLGHVELARELGITLHGDFRLNAANSRTVAELEALGIDDVILSPELTLPQIRDIDGCHSTIVYGRIPLMVLEKCIARESSDCNSCKNRKASLTDRRGVSFPVLREFEHRNTVYNSLPTYMGDRRSELEKYRVGGEHFIFSTEEREECRRIIEAYESGAPLSTNTRRIRS